MALSLYFSHSTEKLYQKIAEQLRQPRAAQEPWEVLFDPPKLLVPNKSVMLWFSLQLAQERGVVMGQPIEQLERYLWNALHSDTSCDGEKIEKLDGDLLQQWLLTALDKVVPSGAKEGEIDEIYHPLRSYLEGGGTLRRVALSAQLSRLFLEYELNRPAVRRGAAQEVAVKGFEDFWNGDVSGQQGLYFSSKASKEKREQIEQLEKWQRSLYIEMFGNRPGVLTSGGRTWMTLPALARHCKQKGQFGKSVVGKEVLLFSPMGLSHFHRNTLMELPHQLTVYQLNPCSEFWEDVQTTRSRSSRQSRWAGSDASRKIPHFEKEGRAEQFERPSLSADPNSEIASYHHALYNEADENRLLSLWGEVSKESVTLWCQASDYQFEFEGEGTQPPQTMLQEVRERLLHRTPDNDPLERSYYWAEDRSLELVTAPTKLREVEALRDRILQLLQKNSSWKLSDFLVIVPNLNSYRSAIHRAFAAPAAAVGEGNYVVHPIAISLEQEMAHQSLWLSAARSLLHLLQSSFGRTELFEFFRNPLLQEGQNISASEVASWEMWVNQLNIYSGYDGATRFEALDVSEATARHDLHTWWWGIQRLLLAEMSDEPLPLFGDSGLNTGEDGEEQRESRLYPFKDMESSDDETLGQMIQLVEGLYRQIETLKQRWCGWTIDEQLEQFEAFLRRWLPIGLAHADEQWAANHFYQQLQLLSYQKEAGRSSIPLNELLQQLLTKLDKSSESHTVNLQVGKLHFVSPRAGTIAPHKALFWLGMGSGEFPGRDNSSLFNLLNSRRIIGDQWSSAQKKFAFLESILAAQEQLWISWQGEDIVKQAELTPSSVVLEFEEYLSTIIDAGPNWRRWKVPLLQRDIPKEKSGEKALFLEEFAPVRTAPSSEQPSEKEEREREEKQNELPTPRIYRTADLALYLRSPFRYHLQKQHGFYDRDQEDPLSREREPLELDHLEKWQFRNETAEQILELLIQSKEIDPKAFQAAIDAVQLTWRESGRDVAEPVSPFTYLLYEELQKTIKTWVEKTSEFREDKKWEIVRNYQLQWDDGMGRQIEETIPLLMKSDDELVVVAATGSEYKEEKPFYSYKLLLQMLLLTAEGELRPTAEKQRKISYLLLHREGVKEEKLFFMPDLEAASNLDDQEKKDELLQLTPEEQQQRCRDWLVGFVDWIEHGEVLNFPIIPFLNNDGKIDFPKDLTSSSPNNSQLLEKISGKWAETIQKLLENHLSPNGFPAERLTEGELLLLEHSPDWIKLQKYLEQVVIPFLEFRPPKPDKNQKRLQR